MAGHECLYTDMVTESRVDTPHGVIAFCTLIMLLSVRSYAVARRDDMSRVDLCKSDNIRTYVDKWERGCWEHSVNLGQDVPTMLREGQRT